MLVKINKLIMTSKTGHFGTFLGYDDRYTYPAPPVSTIIGILQTIYNREIDNFKFGYLFESDLIFKDDMTIHKKGLKVNRVATDIRSIELHYNCKLTIYTDITDEISMDYILSMGRAGNIARLHLPVKQVEFKSKQGQGFNQFTTKDLGEGRIKSMNLKSEYNKRLDSYDHQVGLLRFNQIFNYDRYYDEEEKQNVFMWEMRSGKVGIFND